MFFSNNKSSTEILFNDRKNYEVTMPIMLQDPNLYFDLWKENYNLGRIDYKGNAIFLSESFLKPIDDDHSAIFFVTECFNELKTHWEKLIKRGLVTNIDLTPKRSYIDFHANYHDYIEEIHRDSVVYMSQASVLKKVRNINDYIMFFLTFAQKNNIKFLIDQPLLPLLRTAFIPLEWRLIYREQKKITIKTNSPSFRIVL